MEGVTICLCSCGQLAFRDTVGMVLAEARVFLELKDCPSLKCGPSHVTVVGLIIRSQKHVGPAQKRNDGIDHSIGTPTGRFQWGF